MTSLVEAYRRQNLPIPDTFIPDARFHALIDRLKEIVGRDDEETDAAIHFALMDDGRIAPESWQDYFR